MFKVWAIALLMSFTAIPALAQLAVPEIADQETGKQKCTFAYDGKLVMESMYTHTKTVQDGRTFVTRKVEATWYLAKTPIPFTEESIIELTPEGARTLSWKKDSYGDENESWTVSYDWDKMKVRSTWTHRPSGKTKDKTLDLTPDVVTGEALELMMRGFPFEKNRDFKLEAKVLFGGDTFLPGYVVHRGEETIDTAWGKKEAYKLELKPTGIKGALAPAMYYYFAKEAPHVFLMLDGRAAGPFEPRTKDQLVEFEPKAWVE